MTQEYDFSGLGEPDAHLTATRRAKAEDISPAGQSVGQDEAPLFDFSGLGAPDAMYGMSDRVERLAASGALVDATGDYAGDVRADMAELELASLPSVQGWRTTHDPLFGTDARLVDLPSAESLDTWDAGNEAGVADEHEATVMRAAYALDMAGRVSPEAALEALRAARLTGTPFSAALRNRDAARRVLQLPGLDDLRAAGPRTLAALADTEASLVAHDDVKHLSGLERALDKFAGTVRAIGNIPYRAPSVAGRSAGQMAMMVGGAVQYAANAGGLATALPGYRDDANPLHLLGRAIENVGKGSAEHYQEVLDLPELAARPQADYTAEQVWEKPLLMLDPEWLATQGGDVLVQQLVNIAAYVAGGAPLAALAGGAQEAGAFWQQLRDDGMDVNTALSASLAFGMATGVLESLGAGAFFADSAAAEASRAAAMRVLGKLPARAQGAALDVAAKVGAGATEGLTEYLENPIQNGIEAIAQGQPLPQVLSAMAEGLRDLTPIGPAALLGLGAGGRVHRPDAGLSRASFISPQAREIAQLMADIGQDAMAASSRVEAGAALAEAAAAVDASRLHGRSADIFEEVAAGLLPEEAGNLWLDADTVRSYAQGDLVPHENEEGEDAPRAAVQTVDPARLEALGVTPEELEAAGRSGAPMQVDTLRVLSRTSGGERDALLASARLAPSGMTLDEAHDHDPEARMRDGLMRVRSTAQVTADVAKEERRIASELRAAGLARHVAQGYAALHAEQARAFSARYGVDPVVLLARRRFVQGSEVPEIEAEEGDGWSGTGDDGKEVLTFAQAAKKSIYSDDRSVRMDFEDTGVEPSLTDREQLRAYLESLHPADVKRLKLEDENAYLAMLKSIVRKFFPEKGTLRFRKEGEALDYAHFVGRDVQRDSYVHTLLTTLKNDDITVEFATAEGKAKAYLIKKYFDAELQKDIWDMLVLHDGELTTKIARKGRKGGGYVESQIMGAGNEASHSATTGGAIENASTPRGEYALTITPAGNEGKTAPDSQAKGEMGHRGELSNEKQNPLWERAQTNHSLAGTPGAVSGHSELRENDSIAGAGVNGGKTSYSQPLNPGVDLDAPVRVVEVAPRFAGQNPKILRKRFPGEIRQSVLEAFNTPEGVVNRDTGMRIGMSSSDFREHLKFEDTDSVGGIEQLEAVAVLPELMREAKLVESYSDKKDVRQIKQMHRFQAALRIGEKDYSVKMTVKEYHDGALTIDSATGLRLYHHRLEKEMPTGNSDEGPQAGVHQPSADISSYSLRALLADVKDSEGKQFMQGERARVTFSEGEALVRLFKGADLSSVAHESGHIFLDDLESVAAADATQMLESLDRRLGDLGTLPVNVQAEIDRAKVAATEGRLEDIAKARKVLRDIQRSAEQDGNAHMTRAARRADTALGGLASHMRGLEKARADLAALREWAGVPASGDLTAAQRKQWHEATARGFEAYLREGTPPSQKLSGLFATFRRWLTAIYRRSRDLDVELTDEVRTVFDRMLATDDAMRRHRDISVMLEGEGGFISQLAEAAGGDTEIALRLDDLRNKAEQNVQAGMDAATLRDRSERLAGHRREARRMVAEHPLWSALTFLSRGPGLNRAHLVENYGTEAVNELAKRRPGLVRSKGGMALDDVANERGFEDADTLWNEMYDRLCLQRETQASATEDLAQQMLAAEDAEADPGDMFLAGDSYGEYLEAVDTELLKLMAREKGWKTPEAMAARVDALRTPREYIRAVAANEIGSTPLRDVRPDRYSAALRKALGERTRSLASGDLRMAFRALEQVRIAHELGTMAVRVRREMEDAEVLGRRLAGLKPGAVDNLAAEGIRRVLHSYGLGGASAKARNLADALVPLRDILAAYHGGPDAPMDVAPSFPDWLLDGRGPDARREPGPDGRLDYRNLTHGELRDVVNLLRHLEHMGREARGAEKNTEAARVTAVANEAAASMRDLPAASTTAWRGTERRRWQDVRDKFWAEHTALRWQFGAADAYANIGPDGHAGVNEQALFGAITEGEEKLRALRHDLATRLTPIMDRLSQRVRDIEKQHGKKLHIIGRDGKPLAVPSLWAASGRNHWTVDNALALALNMGNESNMQRVLAGYQDLSYESVAQMLGDDMATRLFALRQKEGAAENVFTPPAITGPKVQGLFTREDWQDIQQILDVIDSLWPETEAVHKRLYGFAPNKVEAKGILLPGLGHLYLNGGYYPVMYDGHLSGKVAAWTEADDILNRNDALFQTPAAKRGHTKARSDGAPGLPVRLDTGVLLEHIDNAARFIAFAEPVRFVDKVTQSPAWREQYVRAFGKHDHDAIRSNLRGLVRNDAPAESGIVMGADILRKYIVNVGLAWNIKTALLQSTAVFPAMQDIGREYVWAGIKKLYTAKRDAVGIIREIQAVSPYMASRAGNIDQDMQQFMRGIAPEKRSLSFTVRGVNIDYEKVVEAGMLPIVYMDMVATTAVWLGAYQKRMDELAGAKGSEVQLGSIDPQKAGHEEAMRYADDAVKRSNPDFDASSRSSFLRSNGAARLFNMFCSATELYAQRQRTHAAARKAGKLSWRGYARFQLYDTLLPATAMWLLQAVARGMFGSDDDREKLPGLWLASLLDFASARLPVFGSPLVELATGEYGARGGARVRSTLDAGFDVLGKARRGTGALFGDWDDDTLSTVFWAVGDIISMAARIPVAQRLRSAVRGYEQWQDGEGTPLSLVMPRPKHF